MKKAFTLIELLVVIAIIAILAAILFPVFAQAKLAAKKSVDLSNQKQIGLAMLMYANDNDDMFPRNDYRLPTRFSWAAITFREVCAPYVKNGVENVNWVMLDSSTTGPVADGGIWESPGQPAGSRYGYGTNGALLPSGQLWSLDGSGASGNNYIDQDSNGNATGESAVPSTSQTQLPHPASTLLMTTMGIVLPWNSANTYMQSGVYWWAGAGRNIRGATPPPTWDSDNAQTPTYDGNDPGPYSSLPRFRYTNSANVVWGDGHAKSKSKGALSWCSDMFVQGSIVDPWSAGAYDDNWAFSPGNVCAGYQE
ncbi:MAG TPA: prepilin-type N-terminal cleavage/methylation domain-containing protein [Fimbriimonas sp.]|nr:prepilin-type N-terminal cleavage/methylation domain-containing protein [Fimbriimonas sp.]